MKKQNLETLGELNMSYNIVYYDCNIGRNCSYYRCDEICRCGKIINCEITSIDFEKIANYLLEYYNAKNINNECYNELLDYLKNNINSDSFRFNIVNGYYGEEMDGIYLYSYIAGDLMQFTKELISKYGKI